MIENYHFSNWAKTYSCNPAGFFEPENENELREILKEAQISKKTVRLVGAGHSPSDLCCTDGFMISIHKFDKILHIDKENSIVEVEAGIFVDRLVEKLAEHDLALHILASVSNFTLAGMISTATHNTGLNYHVTTAYALRLDIMKADGSVITCSKNENPDVYWAAGAGLGAMGVILRVTLQCTPMYQLRMSQVSQDFDQVLSNIQNISESSDYSRIFYIPHVQKLTIHYVDKIFDPEFREKPPTIIDYFWNHVIGYRAFEFLMLISVFFKNRFLWLINYLYHVIFYSKTYHVTDTYKNIFTVEVKLKQYAMEWAIPIENTEKVMKQLKNAIEAKQEGKKSAQNFPAHFPVEIRFVKGDQFWMSPAYGRNSAYINVLAFRPFGFEPGHETYWETFAEIMTSSQGRPHLAKDHPFTADQMRKSFPKFDDFCRLRQKMDPQNLFANAYIKRVLGVHRNHVIE